MTGATNRATSERHPDPATSPNNAIKTYRYLRLAMPTLVVLLFAALTIEWFAGGRRCLQESVSAYYYTPVQAVFVGVLVAVGVCLVAIKGSTEWEDILLNAAGMFAPIVAFVPTPRPGVCRSVPVPAFDTAANVANNVGALLVMGVVAVLVTVFVARREVAAGRWERRSTIGLATAVVTLLAVAGLYLWARAQFVEYAHYVAAFVMFGCIVGVVVINARLFGEVRESVGMTKASAYTNRYAVVAVLMVVATVVMYGVGAAFGWRHAVLWIEGVLILLFATFWVLQTQELWNSLARNRARLRN